MPVTEESLWPCKILSPQTGFTDGFPWILPETVNAKQLQKVYKVTKLIHYEYKKAASCERMEAAFF